MNWRAALLWTGLLLIAGSAAFIGAVPTKIFGHDIFVLLDNGWRIQNGQRPHLDYFSQYGPLTFLVTALGLSLTGEAARGVGVGSALFALAIGIWCYFAARAKLRPILLTFTCLYLAALSDSPYPLGLLPIDSSHAMVYNRYGYALLGLILVGGGLTMGAALALACFLKASYFVVGSVLVVMTLVFRRSPRKEWLKCFAAFAFVAFLFLWYLRFDVAAMFHDLRMTAGARSQSWGSGYVLWKAFPLAWSLLAIASLGWVVGITKGKGRAKWAAAGILVFAADVLLLSGNAQTSGLPLVAVAAVLMLNEAGSPSPATVALAALLLIPQFASDLAGLAYGSMRHIKSPPAVPFASARLSSLKLLDGNSDPESNGTVYTNYFNDGVSLLKRFSEGKAKVWTMDMTNPFPYALAWPPPRGGVATTVFNITISRDYHPTADEYFGDAEIVMVPKKPSHNLALWTAVYNLYEKDLRQRYAVAAESDKWQLWKKI